MAWLIDHACVIVLNGGSISQVATQHNTLSICSCCASEDWWVLILDFTENILEGIGDFGHCSFYF